MRGTKLNLNPVQKTNGKFQNATPNQKVGRKADYAKSISLVPELRFRFNLGPRIHLPFLNRMTVLVNKMNVFRPNIHFGLCTTLPDHLSHTPSVRGSAGILQKLMFWYPVAGLE